MNAAQRAHNLTGMVNGTIVTAGVLVVSAADEHPDDFAAGAYV